MLATMVYVLLGAICIGLTCLIVSLFYKLIRKILNV